MKPRCVRAFVLVLVTLGGCGKEDASNDGAKEVVLYSSIDEPDLRGLIDRFEKESGIRVRVVTDTEATKTTLLAQRLEAEKNNPRADVYWDNEIFHMIDLAGKGLFSPYRPGTAADVSAAWRDDGLTASTYGVALFPPAQLDEDPQKPQTTSA